MKLQKKKTKDSGLSNFCQISCETVYTFGHENFLKKRSTIGNVIIGG